MSITPDRGPAWDDTEGRNKAMALALSQQSDPMLSLIERAARDPGVDVGKMERLLDMAEKVHARRAEAEYDQAMNAAQAEMRPVAQDSENPQTRSRYASYGAMDGALRPIYTQHGFSLSFGTKASAIDRVTVTCRVSHRAGHTERVEIDMPADGKGARGNDVMTKTHATGSAVSYGMRYLLKMIFNVSIGEHDDDGNAAGANKSVSGASRPAPTPKVAPSPKPAPAKATPKTLTAVLNGFQERCKAKLVEKAYAAGPMLTYWQRYCVDKGWILENEPIDAILGNATAVFVLDRAKGIEFNSLAVQEQFLAHEKAVLAMAQVPPPISPIDDEPIDPPEPAEPPISIGGATDAGKSCPNCGHGSVVMSKDFDGILLCQACAWQWDVQTGDYYEEHEWQGVVCPIPPKGTKKADYDKQPMTLGQIFRLDHKRGYGLIANNQQAKPWIGRDGKQHPPSKQDEEFALACRAAWAHMESSKGDSGEADPDNSIDRPF